MKYTILFMVLGVTLMTIGLRNGGVALCLVWLGLSFLLTGLGHATVGARVYGKRASGVLPVWSKILHAPFLLYTWAVWHIARCLSHEDIFNCVNDSLVIGRRVLPHELPEDIDNWVDLTAEFDEPSGVRQKVLYIALPILDGGVPAIQELREALDKLKPGTTYVHCAQGHGRTGLFGLALLLKEGAIQTIDEGLKLLREARPGLELNGRQKRFVKIYAEEAQPSTTGGPGTAGASPGH